MKKNRLPSAGIIFGLILLAIILSVGCAIWDDYRDEIMQNQKNQMLITSEILAKNMELSLNEYRNSLRFLCSLEKIETDKTRKIYRKYLEEKNGFEEEIFLENEQGNWINSVKGMQLKNPLFITKISPTEGIWQYENENQRKFMVFKQKLDDGQFLCLAVNEEQYYQQLISGIRIGTNGYIMVKNSTGIILMHPEPNQWGIHVIDGRKKMYPTLNFSSLETMIAEQCSGNKGISEYFSYWWGNPVLSRVKKISAYAPVKLGDDFLVISAVVDYDDFCTPVEAGFQKVSLLFIGALAAFTILMLFAGKLLFEQRQAMEKIIELRELNERLEEIHQGEEMLAHQQRLQVMGTMTGGIAHEFNNFLTPIMGYAELLMLELDEESDEYDNAREIYRASEKAKDVIRQIASLSRKNVETVYKSIPAEKLCSRVLKMIESICPSNVHLEKEITLQGEYILGNATQLNQVVLNICINAVHGIGKKEGQIVVRVNRAAKEELSKIPELENVHIAEVWEKYLHMEIEDNGCGMDADTLRQIFIPFFTTKKTGEGTGLGLALAEQIITSHKGYIFARSSLGEGSTFHIFLPAMEAKAEEDVIQDSRKKEMKIVIGDENMKILQMLKKNFLRLNIQVFTAKEKKELLQLLEEEHPQVLVVNERIEHGSGVNFCMSIYGKYPEMIKIIMADCFTREIVEAKQQNIIDGYVAKPVSDTTILEAVRNSGK